MRRRVLGDSEKGFIIRNRKFQEQIPDVEIQNSGIVIGFDTSSWILADRCRAMDKPFILDQSIGHPVSKERVYDTLRRKFPDWSETIARKDAEYVKMERREHELAKHIVVPSEFVAATLVENGVSLDKITINPYGTDTELFHPPAERRQTDQLIFLFVGTYTARKGLPVLLKAWMAVKPRNARLLVVGAGSIPASVAHDLPKTVEILGKKTRTEVALLMQQADVFVFPSLFEGLAQVQIEALASGLPVFGTRESGAADVVGHGVTGLVLPAGDDDAWATALEEAVKVPDRVRAMQEHVSRDTARYSWRAYGDRWARILGNSSTG